MPAALFRYPAPMKQEIERAQLPYWSEGGEYKRLSEARKRAEELAEEKNFPIELLWMGQARVIYPEALKDKGYY